MKKGTFLKMLEASNAKKTVLFFPRKSCYFHAVCVSLAVSCCWYQFPSKFGQSATAKLLFLHASRSIAKKKVPKILKRGVEIKLKNCMEKVIPKGTQKKPKSSPKSTESMFWKGFKKGFSPGPEKS